MRVVEWDWEGLEGPGSVEGAMEIDGIGNIGKGFAG